MTSTYQDRCVGRETAQAGHCWFHQACQRRGHSETTKEKRHGVLYVELHGGEAMGVKRRGPPRDKEEEEEKDEDASDDARRLFLGL